MKMGLVLGLVSGTETSGQPELTGPYVSFRCPPFSGPDLGLKFGVA